MKLFLESIRQAIYSCKKNPLLLMPFLVLALIEAVILYLIFLSPQRPFSIILAPPIRAFFGDQFLHYPHNLGLVPKLFGKVGILINFIPGLILGSMQILCFVQVRKSMDIEFRKNFMKTIKAYMLLLCFSVVTFFLVKFAYQLVFEIFRGVLSAKILSMTPIVAWIKMHPKLLFLTVFFLTFPLQMVFVYASPLILLKKTGVIKTATLNFKTLAAIFVPTLMLFLATAVCFVPLAYLKMRIPVLMIRFYPEIVLLILYLEIILKYGLNILLTNSTTYLYLETEYKIK